MTFPESEFINDPNGLGLSSKYQVIECYPSLLHCNQDFDVDMSCEKTVENTPLETFRSRAPGSEPVLYTFLLQNLLSGETALRNEVLRAV